VAMVAMEPMAVPYAADADHAAPVTDVTSPEPGGANVTSAETAAAEATTTEAAAHATAEAATAMTAAAMTAAHQHQQTALCIQIGVTGIDRLREGCRGRKSNRKSADDTTREDAAFHDCTSRGGHLHDKFIAPPQAIAGSSIGDRSAAIGVFTEEHASVAQPLVSQAETASTPKAAASPAGRESLTDRDPLIRTTAAIERVIGVCFRGVSRNMHLPIRSIMRMGWPATPKPTRSLPG